MMDCIELNTVNHYVLAKQHLADSPISAAMTSVVRDAVGLHASDSRTPYLSLLARVPDFEKEDLEKALYEGHSLAKIRCMRKTIYVHGAESFPAVYAATGASVAKASENYMIYRGVSLYDYEAVSEKILKMLAGNPLTARQLKSNLATDMDISAVLYYMCDTGLLLRDRPPAGWLDKQHRYSVLSEVYPGMDLQALSEKDGVALLVRDYIAAFGPVTDADIAWWSGLGKIRVRSALRSLRDELLEVRICGRPETYRMLREDLESLRDMQSYGQPNVNLLPASDGYVMGYADRSRFLEPKHGDRVIDNSGNVTNTVLVDGQILGVWDVEDTDVPTVKVHMFEFVQHLAGEKIYAQAKRLGSFVCGRDVRFRQCDKMEPLDSRSAGSFKSPLSDC
jgi:hypothetical protein